jgi:hypothetical protein
MKTERYFPFVSLKTAGFMLECFYTGRGAVWLAHLHGVQGVAGSSPVAPIDVILRLYSAFTKKEEE